MAETRQIETAVIPYTFSGMGEIYSFTTVLSPPAAFRSQAPYILALVRLKEGNMVTAQITDLAPGEQIQIGDQVEMVTRKIATEGKQGTILYGYKFRKVICP